MAERLAQVGRLIEVMHALREGCPWDAQQTHESLVPYLVEETFELVEAIEAGSQEDLVEELGDVLLQVVFHAEIAAESGRFDIDDVAERIADKLVARHPYVFADSDVPADLVGSWEQAKAREKRRTSVLAGIPQRMSALSRAQRVVSRAHSHGVGPGELGLDVPEVDEDAIGREVLRLVAAAHALGVDPEQAARKALRALEERLVEVEGGSAG